MIGYKKMSREKKEDVSLLVLQMQNLLTKGESSTKSVISAGGKETTVSVPTKKCLLAESTSRKKVL